MAIDLITEEQVARIRAGDREAFEQLFRTWYARLASYAERVVASPDVAEDVVQDVLVAIWNRRGELPEGAKLGAYLHRSVRNRALNHLRNNRHTEGLAIGTDDEPSIAASAETELEDAELAIAVQTAMESLAPRTREVFLLHRQQELTYNEIASTLGISIKTVETLMGRALRALRETLKPRLTE